MATLMLCRHGSTEWNLLGRYQGQSDIPLNEQGVEQARRLADELAAEPIDAVYASALQRAWRTAEIIAEPHGVPVIREPRLNEVNEGSWEGLTLPEILERYAEDHARWIDWQSDSRPTNGESIAEILERVRAALAELYLARPGGRIVIVSHKVTLNVLRSYVTGIPLAAALQETPANGSLFRCEWEGQPPQR